MSAEVERRMLEGSEFQTMGRFSLSVFFSENASGCSLRWFRSVIISFKHRSLAVSQAEW